jgi:hypothetical protein
MSSWTFWNWLAYSGLFVSAIVIAVREKGKDMTSPTWFPKFVTRINWSYVPLLLILLSTGIFLSQELGWVGSTTKVENQTKYIKWPDPYNPVPVINKTFTNEQVILDGHSYQHCTFTNVTFVYNGTTPFQFSNNNIYGLVNMKSDNPSVTATFELMDAFLGEYLPSSYKLILPPGAIHERIKRAP